MRKILFALMAVCAMTFSFTSCEKNLADPENEPIAGKNYSFKDASGESEFQFHMNHTMTSISILATTGQKIQSSNFTWSMSNPNITISGGGRVCYTGVYHPETSSITITEKLTGAETVMEFTEIKDN